MTGAVSAFSGISYSLIGALEVRLCADTCSYNWELNFAASLTELEQHATASLCGDPESVL